MINKKFILILACAFIIVISSSCVMASEDINTDYNSDISSNNQYNLVKSAGQTYVVDGSATNQMSNPTIQDAIDKAKNGDTIEITGTNYEHCHFVVNKNLTIISKVGTTMSTCPSNTDGSNGIGIFYISSGGSGTILSGFNFINDRGQSGSIDTYAVYINGATDVKIVNCTVEKVSEGPGIYLNNVKNTEIINTTIKESQKGIYLENCNNINIRSNSIYSNNVAGVYVGANCKNINISFNNIYSNNFYGIYLGSADNTLIYSNKIYSNRDNPIAQRAEKGTGIYVDTTVTNLQIKGNLIQENGNYGIYDSPKFTNMNDQYAQIVDGNFFIRHNERGIYHADPNGQTTIVYVWSNYYSDELFCGGTSYAPGVLVGDHPRDLIMSKITEIENGVYSVSFIRKDTGEVATSLNSIEIIFFLNKKDTNPVPGSGDIYRICAVKNGTAIADFRNETFLETGNTITAVGPGNGIITYSNSGSRPSQKLSVADSNIPKGVVDTTISGNGLNKYYGNNAQYVVTLLANGKPLANKNVNIKINGKTYKATTDSQGLAKLDINLASNTYTVEIAFDGDENYEASRNTDSITIKPTIIGNNIVKYYRNGTHYTVQILDSNGKAAADTAVTFSIVGATYIYKTDSNGMATLPINLNPGEYTITAYNTLTEESLKNSIKVLPVSVTLSASPITMNYKDGTQYSVKLLDENKKPIAGKIVSLYINGKSFKNVKYDRTTNNQGTATLPINLNPGEYTITAKYATQSITTKVTVKAATYTLNAQNIQMTHKDGTQYSVVVLDGNKNPVKGQTVSLYINGKSFKNVKYDRTTNNQGTATLPINLNPGEYTITAKYATQSITTKVTVKAATYTLNAQNIQMTHKDGTQYSVQLLDQNKKPMTGKTVSLYINGKTFKNLKYDRTTNNQGTATLPINLNPGEYTITAVYGSEKVTNTLTVSAPTNGPIKSNDIKMVENDRIPFTVKLLDGSNKPIVGKQVTFKVVGATYIKTSDKNGIASLPINLAVGKYVISSEYNGHKVSNNIEVAKATSKIDTRIIANDLAGDSGEDLSYTILLKNKNNKPLSSQNVNVEIDGKTYALKTNANGEAKLVITLEKGVHNANVKYGGNNIYNPSATTSKITVSSIKVVKEATNKELQDIINSCEENGVVKLTAKNYDNVSITINKPITLTTDNSVLKGVKNKDVISIYVDGVTINGFEIIAFDGNAINLNGNNSIISNCNIKSNLNLSSIDDHDYEKVKIPGNGIRVNSSKNNRIENNNISKFGNGIYIENANNTTIKTNTLTKNNYGIEFGANVSNTLIENNKINENIGLITLDVVEGPSGYGISIRESGVNVTILYNEINSNYMGIFIDAQNCTGIKIVGNSITDNVIEGLTFNENYTYAYGAPAVIVENNAIYNNAKGPSMIILGEVSANPAGIYGPGEWDDDKKLKLGANWYGTNKYTTWGNITGPGTICPRISTKLITFNLTCVEPGKYSINFYNNGTPAATLPDFKVYFVLNFYTDKQIETVANVHKGVATIEFPAANYFETKNVIEAFSGSIFDKNRQYPVIDTYNVPDIEIKK